ncbi:phenylalanine--tRNA ligase subunit alpha [candidate division WOR-3 bacterium]|nr:phenylalanine--tRNA ligase subunit alpha [candidate division WOR-3 bacterium]
MTRLPELEYSVLAALEPGRDVPVVEVVKQTGRDQSLVMAGATMLAQKGYIVVTEESDEELSLTEDGIDAADRGLPERRAAEAIIKAGGTVFMPDLPKLLGKDDTRNEVKWLTKKGWVTREAGRLAVQPDIVAKLLGHDELLLIEVKKLNRATVRDLSASGVNVKAALELLKGRNELLKRRKRSSRRLSLTDEGAKLKASGIEPAPEVTQLSPELLVAGRWREVVFKKYDPNLATAPRYPGKEHPLGRVVQEIRRAFLEMGFEEVASPTIDTAFWVFDALFQPQDHPAREMQDTFYMDEPANGRLPDRKLVRTVGCTHENGGDTGSTGWRYQWDPEKAGRLVLRTHTTAASIRALAANPNPPRKVFCIGKTFRREATDQTHLAEFMQIDGIIIDEQATLATLFGTLEAFYKKMGAEEVRFRPSFFPYTEPSAEVFAKMGKLGWVEMCGSGVFRPEVTEPLGCKVPVLAWGGGVERIAMLRYGIDDIRKLYLSDIDWLRQARLSR